MSAQYRVTFHHKETGARHGVYLSSADAKSFKKVDIKAANKKAIDKAKAKLDKKPTYYGTSKDNVVVEVLCVG